MSLSLIDLKDEEIVQALSAKYEHHLAQANRFKAMLVAYGLDIDGEKKVDGDSAKNGSSRVENGSHNSTPSVKGVPVSSGTFLETVLSILSDFNRPLTINELHDEYGRRTKKVLPRNSFSSKVSNRAARSGKVNHIGYPELPIDKRFYWGLLEWFDGEDFKNEYKNKITAFEVVKNNLFK